MKHDEVISMLFFKTWKDRKVTINGMSFDILKETIESAGEFLMEGNNWRR